MNILICDDIRGEALELEKTIMAAAGGQSGLEAHCSLFYNGTDVLAHIKSGAKTDVCFLDILMPDINGTELAQKMREEGFKGAVVFLTSTNAYAAEAFSVMAYSYILKPPKTEKVAEILTKIQEAQKSADTAGITIHTRTMTRFLLFREISHIEVKLNYVYYRLLDGSEIELKATLSEFLPKIMEDKRFAQCHRSYVVNMNAVDSIQNREVFMECGRKAPISKNYMGFVKQYSDWVFGNDSN
jgi:DNA-binding LytR/AlgR family response regulator